MLASKVKNSHIKTQSFTKKVAMRYKDVCILLFFTSEIIVLSHPSFLYNVQ